MQEGGGEELWSLVGEGGEGRWQWRRRGREAAAAVREGIWEPGAGLEVEDCAAACGRRVNGQIGEFLALMGMQIGEFLVPVAMRIVNG